jgi:hypothetical protein
MKKVKILMILVIAVLGAFLIYKKFEHINSDQKAIDKFVSDYTLMEENHVFEIINIDESINIINNKTGIIFFCNPGSNWCQHYAKILDDIAVQNEIEKIYYVDIKDDRSINSNKYRKLVTKLQDYLDTDDTGNKRLSMPNLTFVKNGEIIANDNRTSLVSSDTTPEEYWTRENILTFKNKIIESILLLETETTTPSEDTLNN